MAAGQSDPRPLISVIVPVFNEEANVGPAHAAIREVFAPLHDRYRLEILFSDNHSTDATFERLAAIATRDPEVKVIRLARNYGFQRSVLTAYRTVQGDAAVQIDCDLEDPPELILEFVKKWESGHDVVVGIRRQRPEGWLMQMLRRGFYRLVRRISDDNFLDDAGDFRLVDRSVIRRLHGIRDARPYTRGLISSLAARQTGIPYDRVRTRQHGVSKFPARRLFGMATDGIVNHSLVPLRIAGLVGVGMFFLAVALGIYYLLVYLFGGQTWPRGFFTLTLLLLASLGINAMLLGILGEYVGRIYEEVRVRPLSLIERTINLDLPEPEGMPDRKEARQ